MTDINSVLAITNISHNSDVANENSNTPSTNDFSLNQTKTILTIQMRVASLVQVIMIWLTGDVLQTGE